MQFLDDHQRQYQGQESGEVEVGGHGTAPFTGTAEGRLRVGPVSPVSTPSIGRAT